MSDINKRADIHLHGRVLFGFNFSCDRVGLRSALEDNTAHVDELVCLYEKWRTAAFLRRGGYRDGLNAHPIPPDLASLFQSGSTAHDVLRSKGPSKVPRIVSLIYLNLLFYSFHISDGGLNRARVYQQNFLDTNVVGIPANETILWGLMTDTRRKTLMDPPLMDCTMRMLGMSRVLSVSEQECLADTLCDFLCLGAEDDVVGTDRWWSPSELGQLLKQGLDRLHLEQRPAGN